MSGLLAGFGGAFAALIAASLLHAFLPRHVPAVILLAIGYIVGTGGLGWVTEERVGRALPLALMLGAGWISVGAARVAVTTFRRTASRSGIGWAAGFAFVGPSCLAGCLAPIAVTLIGPAGLSIPALIIVVAAAILADPSPFRSRAASDSINAHRLREAIRTSEAFKSCVLLAWPAYWAVARALSLGDGPTAEVMAGSVALSYGAGIALGILGILLVRIVSGGLLMAAFILIIVVSGAVLSSILAVSSVAVCFLAALLIAQEKHRRDLLFNSAKNLEGPFRVLFLTAVGAAAPRWSGIAGPLLIVAVVLAGRFMLGFLADAALSSVSGGAPSRRIGWILAVPHALSAAMMVEAWLLLRQREAVVEQIEPAEATAQAHASALNWGARSLPPVAPFLLAVGLGDLIGRWLLKRKLAGSGRYW